MPVLVLNQPKEKCMRTLLWAVPVEFMSSAFFQTFLGGPEATFADNVKIVMTSHDILEESLAYDEILRMHATDTKGYTKLVEVAGDSQLLRNRSHQLPVQDHTAVANSDGRLILQISVDSKHPNYQEQMLVLGMAWIFANAGLKCETENFLHWQWADLPWSPQTRQELVTAVIPRIGFDSKILGLRAPQGP